MDMGNITNRPTNGPLNHPIHPVTPTMMTATDRHITSLISQHHSSTISIPTPMDSHLTSVCRPHHIGHRTMVPCHNLPRCITLVLPCTTNSIFTTTPRHHTPISTQRCPHLIPACALIRTHKDQDRMTYHPHLHLTIQRASLRQTIGDKPDKLPRQ